MVEVAGMGRQGRLSWQGWGGRGGWCGRGGVEEDDCGKLGADF